MGSSTSRATVYTLPDCTKCDKLKEWLADNNKDYESKSFTTEAQLEFIMKNMFGNPPILEVEERFASSEELFPNEILNEEKVLEVLDYGKT
jgi:arsenate reductase-like glutaredoxin family protein